MVFWGVTRSFRFGVPLRSASSWRAWRTVGLVGVLGSLFLVAGCHRRVIPPGVPAPPRPKPGASKESLTLSGADLEYKDPKGRTLWKVKASGGVGKVASMSAELRDVECVFFHNGQPAWTCKAASLIATQPTREVRLTGSVTGRSSDGIRSFTAPTLTWNVKSGALNAGPGVTLKMGGATLTGDRLIASSADRKGRITGHARGVIRPK